MRVLLLGANGQVGRECRRALPAQGFDVACASRDGRLDDGAACEEADLAQPGMAAALVERMRPQAVINAAAYTAVDRAETERDLAMRVNGEAVAEIAAACREQDIPLLHYSTDYVFDGQAQQPYAPDAPTAPLGVYGASKLAGEQAIRASGARHVILRTAWVYAAHGHNFLRTMLRLAGERDELRVVADQRGTPTPAALIADVTAHVLGTGVSRSGTWHLTAGGETTWHGFAQAIMEQACERGMLARKPLVMPITSAEFPTPARRPAYSVLDTTRLCRDWGVELPHWQVALGAVLDELNAP
ncbi:dTDP-4-dehydrorhamnose reductase [Luteimonas sp. e5]